MKNLIIYYSRPGQNYWNGQVVEIDKGNTEYIAEFIDEAVGADLFKIETIKDYPIDYYECIEEAQEELKNQDRPELKNYLDSVKEYDNIFICGPCWWGHYPMAMLTQLEQLDFNDKNIYPVMTHEGSGLAQSRSDLKKSCPGAKINKGLAIHGAEARESKLRVSDWAKKVLK